MDGIALEIFTEIWLPHNGLLASKLGKKASSNLGAIQDKLQATVSEVEPKARHAKKQRRKDLMIEAGDGILGFHEVFL